VSTLWLLWALGCGDTSSPSPSDTGPANTQECLTAFSYTTTSSPDEVRLTGSFNDWDRGVTPLTEVLPGLWQTSIALAPGAYPYKFVEYTDWSQGGAELLACDANADLIQCEEGTAADLEWRQDCTPGATSCHSLVVVEDCTAPRLEMDRVTVDRSTGTIAVDVRVVHGISAEQDLQVYSEINGTEISGTMKSNGLFHVERSGLSAQRHTIRMTVTDGTHTSEPLIIPVWMDDWSWDEAVLYHAMIDRVANRHPANDRPEGTSDAITDYAGGDLAGLEAALPYLDDLGVNALWLSNPQAGPDGAWPGDCDATYAGYHGFWPASWDQIDPHLGNKKALKSLIDAAHARNMRVLVDWVGNHVHEDHPVLESWSEDATHDKDLCNEVGPDGAMNWDRIPESCWFAPYLPDLDQTDALVLQESVDQALAWATEYGLDGLRVDAAKHMPHSVSWNLAGQIRTQLEHPGSGFDFYLVGETFDGAEAINAFIDDKQLDGQFDFPLYWQLREAFIFDSASLADVVMSASTLTERYPGGKMSTFLGNLDVGRFTTTAQEWSEDVCPDGAIRQASPPGEDEAYDRLLLAWTVLFTQPGIPLIYYGDEIGLPGYGDPDNRQPLWWAADITAGTVEDIRASLAPGPAKVLAGVQALTAARAMHPALALGQTTEWYAAPADFPTLYAYSRTLEEDAVLVVLSRWTDETTITNSLQFAGLPAGVDYTDARTGEVFTATGDSLTVSVPPMTARVLIPGTE